LAAKLTDGTVVFTGITRPQRARTLLLPEEPADDGGGDDDNSDNERFHCDISRVVVSSAVPASADPVSGAAVHLVSKQTRDSVPDVRFSGWQYLAHRSGMNHVDAALSPSDEHTVQSMS
jgi:hypothetical protein